MKKITLFTALALSLSLCHGYVFEIETLVADGNYVHLLHDVHVEDFVGDNKDTVEVVKKQQRDEVIDVIKRYTDHAETLVITEDRAYGALQHLRRGCEQKQYGFLGLSTQYFTDAGLHAVNRDYRLDPLPENCVKYDCARLLDAENKALAELKTFNDTPQLHAYYQRVHASTHINTTTYQVVTGTDTYAHDFVDAHILHTIYAHRIKKHIFVCCGDRHARAVRRMLQQNLGYTLAGQQSVITIQDILEKTRSLYRRIMQKPINYQEMTTKCITAHDAHISIIPDYFQRLFTVKSIEQKTPPHAWILAHILLAQRNDTPSIAQDLQEYVEQE